MIDALPPRLASTLRRLGQDETAATATEYAVMLALIIMVAIGAIQTFGSTVNQLFVSIEGTLFT